tara:strand:+ start:851 stop:1444 length:594 start_codon:yes stop_codon:yes gene_type:complete
MRRFTSTLLLCGLALGGCTTDAAAYSLIQDHAYSPSEFRHAAANKAVRTVIAGKPFPKATDRATHDAVLAAMQPVNWYQPLPFTPDAYFTDKPKGEHNPEYHVVVALNPDDTKDEWAVAPCVNNMVPATNGPKDDYTVRMVFCRDQTLLSLAHATLEGETAPNEPRFRNMITRTTMELFPQRRDDRDCFGARRKGRC